MIKKESSQNGLVGLIRKEERSNSLKVGQMSLGGSDCCWEVKKIDREGNGPEKINDRKGRKCSSPKPSFPGGKNAKGARVAIKGGDGGRVNISRVPIIEKTFEEKTKEKEQQVAGGSKKEGRVEGGSAKLDST